MKEKLFFRNSKRNRLCGILSSPEANKDEPIIILCHGLSTGKDGNTSVQLEKILNQKNISTFRFDFFGHGESEGSFEGITISEAVDDILNAINMLQESGYTKIGLVGSSFGGMASILAASQTNDIYVLALKSPVSDYLSLLTSQKESHEINLWRKKRFLSFTRTDGRSVKLNYSFFVDAKRVNGYQSAQKIKIPTLIVHGDRDETVPVEQSKQAAYLMKNCRLEVIRDADHRYSQSKDFKKMLELISEFIFSQTQS